jgi:hypothetical protein
MGARGPTDAATAGGNSGRRVPGKVGDGVDARVGVLVTVEVIGVRVVVVDNVGVLVVVDVVAVLVDVFERRGSVEVVGSRVDPKLW